MVKKYVVYLTEAERTTLQRLLTAGKTAARSLTHVHILLKLMQAKGDQAGPTSRSLRCSKWAYPPSDACGASLSSMDWRQPCIQRTPTLPPVHPVRGCCLLPPNTQNLLTCSFC